MKFLFLVIAAIVGNLAFANGMTVSCKDGNGRTEIIGIGTQQATLVADYTSGWEMPRVAGNTKPSDCLNSTTYLCYSDDKAMVNIPLALIRGEKAWAKVYITTDTEDEVPGASYECEIKR